jgi:hypothetical protein
MYDTQIGITIENALIKLKNKVEFVPNTEEFF